jgi:prophage regulatory protein
MSANQFWRLEKVQEETGLSRSGIYEGMADDSFPKSFKISERCVAWLSGDIEAWKAARLAAAGKLREAA